MIRDNIARLKDDIASICNRLGKKPDDVTLVGVTKYASPEDVREAIAGGLSCIAENKVQEAQRKFPSLPSAAGSVSRHMIGHLQTNKVKLALELFDVIQSVDSLKLARAIDRQAGLTGQTAEVYLQVNTSGEPQKFGFRRDELSGLLEEAARLSHIQVTGLMTIAPLVEDEGIIRDCFRPLKELYDTIKADFKGSRNIRLDHLSMGMTADYRIALEEGSNMVRIGRAIFQNE